MRKTLVVASREYLAAVKTKSFIISLILLPIMMSGGLIAQQLGQKIGDTSTKRVAIVDRTPGATLYDVIDKAVTQRNTKEVFDSGRQVRAKFALEKIAPADATAPAVVDRQRVELSRRVRSGELLAFVEIGPDVLTPSTHAAPTLTLPQSTGGGNNAAAPTSDASIRPDEPDDRAAIRYTSNRPTYRDFTALLQQALPAAVFDARLKSAGMSYAQLKPYLSQPRVVDRGLADESEGKVTYESRQGQFAPFLVPLALLMLMFVVVIVGASPMTANVIEEKQLRIAEVLLGSVRPFELMMGKLLGGVGVALTLATIYFGGAYFAAVKQGMAGYITTASIVWFLFFTVVGTLMYGSMFVAAGAAVTNIKEAQTIIMPVMLLIVLPMSLLGNLIQDPSGVLATVFSFFPFSAPMVMTARISIPPGVPLWQAIVSAGVVLLTTTALVWAAGRIFRVGILLQGQGANYAQMARWIIRG